MPVVRTTSLQDLILALAVLGLALVISQSEAPHLLLTAALN